MSTEEWVVPRDALVAAVVAEVADVPPGMRVHAQVLAIVVNIVVSRSEGVASVSGREYRPVALVLPCRLILFVGG